MACLFLIRKTLKIKPCTKESRRKGEIKVAGESKDSQVWS